MITFLSNYAYCRSSIRSRAGSAYAYAYIHALLKAVNER